MGVLMDTSLIVAHERGLLDLGQLADEQLAHRADEPFCLLVITESELLHGAHRAREPVRRARRTAFVEGVLDAFAVLPIDLPTARVHAELGADLARSGIPVGTHDLWIASAAAARGLSLATLKVGEFRRIPGLVVESWGG